MKLVRKLVFHGENGFVQHKLQLGSTKMYTFLERLSYERTMDVYLSLTSKAPKCSPEELEFYFHINNIFRFDVSSARGVFKWENRRNGNKNKIGDKLIDRREYHFWNNPETMPQKIFDTAFFECDSSVYVAGM